MYRQPFLERRFKREIPLQFPLNDNAKHAPFYSPIRRVVLPIMPTHPLSSVAGACLNLNIRNTTFPQLQIRSYSALSHC